MTKAVRLWAVLVVALLLAWLLMPGLSGNERAAGIVSASPAGAWVTSSWPTTKYYTSRGNVAVWGAWAAGNRVWFEMEVGLLRVYPGRVRK